MDDLWKCVISGTMAIRRRALETLFFFKSLIAFKGGEKLRFGKSLWLVDD